MTDPAPKSSFEQLAEAWAAVGRAVTTSIGRTLRKLADVIDPPERTTR